MFKKAKKVEIPTDRVLTLKEWDEFFTHGKNSAIYSVQNYSRNSNQIRQKLYDKGYPREDVMAETTDGKRPVNFVEEIIQHLENWHLLDDDGFAEDIISSKLNQGYGPRKIEAELYNKKVDSDTIKRLLEEIEEDDIQDALELAVDIVTRKSSYYNISDPYKKRQKLSQSLVARGFNYSDIAEVVK